MSRDIEIYIDKLVLDGYDRLDDKALKRVVEAHLTQLVRERGLMDDKDRSQSIRRIQGMPLSFDPQHGTTDTGRSIANGIYKTIQGNQNDGKAE